MKHFGQLEATIRPARHMFADIVLAYLGQRLSVPKDVTDDFEQFERVAEWASYELRTGYWDTPYVCGKLMSSGQGVSHGT